VEVFAVGAKVSDFPRGFGAAAPSENFIMEPKYFAFRFGDEEHPHPFIL